jgi:hypothetical protein
VIGRSATCDIAPEQHIRPADIQGFA